MIREAKRLIAGILVGGLIITNLIPGTVSAEEGNKEGAIVQNVETSEQNPTEESEQIGETDENVPSGEETQGILENVETQTVTEGQDEAPKQEEIQQDDTEEVEEAKPEEEETALEYLYVESPYLETPGNQNLVVSWGDGTEQIEKMELLYQHNDEEISSFKLENKGEGLYLYQREFAEAESGVYALTDIRITQGEQEYTYNLSEMGIEAYFGVNEYYPGYEPEEAEAENAVEGVAVISEDDVKNSEAEEIVMETLESVGVETDADVAISAYSLTSDNTRSSNGQIVVALDAGHDASHAGAYGNGVHEEVATLKIAQYCKAELEQYSGVKVYMCRSTAACPYPGTSATEDIRKRVQASAAQGADVYVSIHLNSSPSSAAAGAEVWYPDSSQTPATTGPGKTLAQKVQAELVKLGLGNRGAKETDDNFACMDEGGKYGLPAIIIEHAFVSNAGDAGNYLNSDAKLQKLGIADATGIANYFGLSKGRWETDSKGNTYYYVGGKKVYGGKKIGDYWYYFDENTGIMKTGWRDKEGKKYYYDSDGRLVISKGLKIEEYWYYFNASGAMLSAEWRDKNGDKYYYDIEGHLVTSCGMKIGDYWYYFGTSGVMYANEWRDKNGDRYYYDAEGHLVTNCGMKIGDYWYYFSASGAIYKEEWREKQGQKYYYDLEGHLITNSEKEIEGVRYYFSASGAMLSNGWREEEGVKYYYDAEGRLVTNCGMKIDNYWYYFGTTGAMYANEWRDKNGDKYYYDTEGHLVTNRGMEIDGDWYYLDASGVMLSNGWREKAGKKYYYNQEGHLVIDQTLEVDGKVYYFDKSGAASDNVGATYLIAGKSSVTVQNMIDYYKKYANFEYPAEELGKGGAPTLEKFCQLYYQECNIEGIKAEVAFAQAMKETAFLKYGGDVKIGQYNFAGLGATGGGEPGASFDDVQTGIRAHVQHLKCYANDEPLKQTRVDPRWSNSLRNKAPYVEWLSIPCNPYGTGWAADPTYGEGLLRSIELLKNI